MVSSRPRGEEGGQKPMIMTPCPGLHGRKAGRALAAIKRLRRTRCCWRVCCFHRFTGQWVPVCSPSLDAPVEACRPHARIIIGHPAPEYKQNRRVKNRPEKGARPAFFRTAGLFLKTCYYIISMDPLSGNPEILVLRSLVIERHIPPLSPH